MAIMIPSVMEEDNNSFGERQVFKSLKKLPDEYTVFHSVHWNDRNEKNTIVWGESDFTILHPKKGIIVIEVKSGGIECRNNSWSYIRTDNNEIHPMKNPLTQADRSKYRFKDIVNGLLEEMGTDNNGKNQYCMVESAVWFPSISRRDRIGTMPVEFHDEIVLLEAALDSPEKYIDGIYDFYEGKRHTNITIEACEKIIETFAPYYRVMPSLKSKRLEQEERFIRLTSEQNSLLDYLEEQRVAAIQGAAGTGKTWLAIEKAKRLSNSGKVLFLCFNQFLKKYLQKLKDENPKEYRNIEFYNLPQLVCQKLKERSVDEDAIINFLENYNDYDWDFKHIVIDEGQDFNDEEIVKLSEISLLEDGAFYVFFDKNQFVQGLDFPEWLKNAECRLVLNINCRNTYSIATTSGKPINVPPKVKRKSVKGDMPQFHICDSYSAGISKLSNLISQYRENGYAYDQICILTLKTETTSFISGVKKIGNHLIETKRGKNNILFTTARKFKGLESDVIIIVDVDENTFIDEDSKRLFYVGASRAKHALDIVFVGDEDKFELLAQAVCDKKYPTNITRVAVGLNVKPIV